MLAYICFMCGLSALVFWSLCICEKKGCTHWQWISKVVA